MGGLAVVVHGYVRATMDVDLVIDLNRENLVNALGALEKIGFRPRLPVSKEQFADPETRAQWIKEKHMLVREDSPGYGTFAKKKPNRMTRDE